MARRIRPLVRGEFEITDVDSWYLTTGELRVEILGRSTEWHDTGNYESLLQVSTFIETIETRQRLKIACPEVIAFRGGWISGEDVSRIAATLGGSSYARHLQRIVDDRGFDRLR